MLLLLERCKLLLLIRTGLLHSKETVPHLAKTQFIKQKKKQTTEGRKKIQVFYHHGDVSFFFYQNDVTPFIKKNYHLI